MSDNRFLAFDIGAESGRAAVGTLQGDRLSLDEIHRFPNEPVRVCETLYWDILALYGNVLKGMREYVRRYGDSVDGIGVDTWSVDFGLIGRDGQLLQNPVHYRDQRAHGMLEEVLSRMGAQELFERSGLVPTPISTLCQLIAYHVRQPSLLEFADTYLMIPDLIAYFLTGQRVGERTNAITTHLYDPRTHGWNDEILSRYDLPASLMPVLTDPASVIGGLRESLRGDTNLTNALVIAPCTHDTSSAVAAIPAEGDDFAFLSSGTWSVVGALTKEVVTSPEAFAAGMYNQLTFGSFFLSRDIMGLWLLQQARATWESSGETYSYAKLVELAQKAPGAGPLIDPDDPGFLAPVDMVQAINNFCARTGQRQPQGPAAVTRCILESLALSYRDYFDQITRILGRSFRVLHVVGGGSRNTLLCQMTADATSLPVIAGPSEATIMGNILLQAVAVGSIRSPADVREVVHQSTELVTYEPADGATWDERYHQYREILERSAN